MKKSLGISLAILIVPLASQAIGNRTVKCVSENASIEYSTVMYGELIDRAHIILDSHEARFTDLGIFLDYDEPLEIFSHNRIFRVVNPYGSDPSFELLVQLFGNEPTLIESGSCQAQSNLR